MPKTRNTLIELGPLTLVHGTGAQPAAPDSYHLLFNHGIPRVLSAAANRTLDTGEAVILGAAELARFDPARSSGIVHLRLPADWLCERLGSPRRFIGVPLRNPDKWCAALNALLAQLTPEVILYGPVAPEVLAEQIGVLLALIGEGRGSTRPDPSESAALGERILARLHDHCANPALTAADVAGALGVSTRTLHRALGQLGETFGELLIHARVRIAARMLEAPNLWRLPTAEIGRRAGFKDASHFAKAFRRQRGVSPTEARRNAQAARSAQRR